MAQRVCNKQPKEKMKNLKKIGGLLAATLLVCGPPSAFSGVSTATAAKPITEEKKEHNPLSFFDGALVFDVQERLRIEGRENNFDFNDALSHPTDDWWLLQRFRIGVLVKPASWLKIYVQGQDSQEIDSDRNDIPGVLGAEGDDIFDLRQAYIEIGNPKAFPLSFKVGRQILSYGDERLIGAFDWNNIGRTFDAAKLRFEQPKWWIDAFVSTVVVPRADSFNKSDLFDEDDVATSETVFYGLYASTTAIPVQTTDFYALGLHTEQDTETLPAAGIDTDFATLGLRIKSKPGAFAPAPSSAGLSKDGKTMPPLPPAKKPVGFDYDAELAVQFGEVRDLDLLAFAAHAGVGYTFDFTWMPRIGIEYNFASGDHDPLDGDIETFQNLFPTNHKFYGYMDVFAWQNIHNLAAQLKIIPVKTLTFQVDYHAFWLADTNDVWYRANGTTAVRPLTPAAQAADSFAGHEIDVTITWTPRKWIVFLAGYSHFFAGDYLADTGASDDADFGYLMATLTF
jgi:Alginate export